MSVRAGGPAPADAQLDPTLDERDRLAELRAEEELHRLRLGRLRRLHLLAAEAGRDDARARVAELAALERERHVGELGRLRLALREPLFLAALRDLAPGRRREGGSELPALLAAAPVDGDGVPVGVALRPAQVERRETREAADRERLRQEAELARRRAEVEQRRLELERQRQGQKSVRRSGAKGRRRDAEAGDPSTEDPGAQPPAEPPPREGGRRGGGRRGGPGGGGGR